MRTWLLLLATACQGPATDGGSPEPTDTLPSGTTGDTAVPITTTTPYTTVKTTGPAPCDPVDGLEVSAIAVNAPYTEHEVTFGVTLSSEAAVAIACESADDPDEVHLIEGTAKRTSHQLQMAGLLADTTYACTAAPVCPTTLAKPYTFEPHHRPSVESRSARNHLKRR